MWNIEAEGLGEKTAKLSVMHSDYIDFHLQMYSKQGIAIQILLESLEIDRGCRFLTAGPAENPVFISVFHFFIAFPFFLLYLSYFTQVLPVKKITVAMEAFLKEEPFSISRSTGWVLTPQLGSPVLSNL